MRKRYLFFDIDGTLLAGGYEKPYLPESARLALEKLRAAGHVLCIATGRAHAMAIDWMRTLNFENMVSDGGYGITINNRLIGIKPLERKGIVQLVRECDRKSIPWGLQIDDSDTRVVPDSSFEDFTHDTYIKTRIVEGLDPENCEKIYKAYVACRPPLEYTLETLANLPFGRYHDTYFFVEPLCKAEGIRQILDRLGANHGDAIVFGDAPNDLSMFTDEWFKVAMGNACPDLKARADMITTRVDEDGIYNACEKLGLFNRVTPEK